MPENDIVMFSVTVCCTYRYYLPGSMNRIINMEPGSRITLDFPALDMYCGTILKLKVFGVLLYRSMPGDNGSGGNERSVFSRRAMMGGCSRVMLQDDASG